MIKPVLRIQLGGRGRSKHQSLCVLTNLDPGAGSNIPEPQYCFKLSVPDPDIYVRILLRDLSFFFITVLPRVERFYQPSATGSEEEGGEKSPSLPFECAPLSIK
jgi:hypothetical protein